MKKRMASLFAISCLAVFLLVGAILPGLAAQSRIGAAPPLERSSGIPVVTRTWPMGEGRLPLVQPEGLINRRFPEGVPMTTDFLQDSPEVTQLLIDLVSAAGLDQAAPTLLRFDPKPYTTQSRYGDVTWSWPYSYPLVDPVVENFLTPELAAQRAPQLVELTSALLFTNRAPAAFSILNRMRGFGNSCEVQLNFAQTVAIGARPDRAIVDREFAEAARLCSDDPIALVAHSRVVLAFDTRGVDHGIFFKVGELDQEDAAVALAREAQTRFPDHAGGYLAEAAILLEVADEYAKLGHHPFTSRSMYQRALALLEAVHGVQGNDPSVAFGIARAQAGLGRATDAVASGIALLAPFTNRIERVHSGEAASQWALDAGDPSLALDFYPEDTRLDLTDRVCRSLNQLNSDGGEGSVELPAPGWRGNCNVQLVDATGDMTGGGADSLLYLNYIPTYRWATPDTDLLAVVAGRSPDATSPQASAYAKAAAGDWRFSKEEWLDSFQDVHRRLGQFDEAESLIRSAIKSGTQQPLVIHDRLGEVLYLQGRYNEAAEEFAQAAQANEPSWARDVTDGGTLSRTWAVIKQSTALSRAGEDARARELLAELVLAPGDRYDWRPGLQELARSTMVGLIDLRAERFEDAVTAFEKAVTTCGLWNQNVLNPCITGAQENNLGIALLKAGDATRGAEMLKAAIARDPANPLFVEGLANNLEALVDTVDAAETYRSALANDPTQFTAHNNLGVLLAQDGDLETATRHFRDAVAANPLYPTAWFNLGVAWSRSGDLLDAVCSQGAFGRAAQLHSGFRNAELDWVTDVAVYDPGLDLSKPLPAEWESGANRKPPPVAFGLPMLIASALLIMRALVSDSLYGRIIERSLGWTSRFARPLGRRPEFNEATAVLPCAAILGLGLASTWGWTPWLTAAGFTAALLISIAFVAARRLIDPNIKHRGTIGGTLLGLVGAPFGVSFAPVPVLDGDSPRSLTRWSPSLAMASLATLAMVLVHFFGVPLVRGMAQALLLVVSSSLIPIAPFDGAHLDKRLGVPLAVALAIPTGAFAAAWL